MLYCHVCQQLLQLAVLPPLQVCCQCRPRSAHNLFNCFRDITCGPSGNEAPGEKRRQVCLLHDVRTRDEAKASEQRLKLPYLQAFDRLRAHKKRGRMGSQSVTNHVIQGSTKRYAWSGIFRRLIA